MHAIILEKGEYHFRECAQPVIDAENVLIKVAYSGVNRADLLQKQGKYPLPDAIPAIPGLEVSGEIVACGVGVTQFKSGDRVCALLGEGGYAEYVAAPASLVLPVPESMTFEEAAALPEACFTAWISLVWQAKIRENETVLVHGGASGIGHIMIQVAVALGVRVFATAGTQEKCDMCVSVGADHAINYHHEDYVKQIKAFTDGKGVDVIVDVVGGDYFGRNLECLARGGRLCVIAFLKGPSVSANISPVLLRHLSVMGSTLRSRPLAEKAQIAVELRNNIWHKLEKGQIEPVIHGIFPLDSAEKALECMEQGLNIGKILIKM